MDTRTGPSRSFYAAQVAIALFINFVFGSIFSAPSFTVAIADAGVQKNRLDHAWPLGIAIASPLVAFLMIPFAVIFNESSAKTRSARGFALLAAIALLCVSLAGIGVTLGSRVLILAGGVMTAFPMAANTVFNIQHLAELFPSHFGLSIGACNVAIGLGLSVTSWFDDALLSVFSVSTALYMFSGTLACMAFIPALFVTFPGDGHRNIELHEQSNEPSSEPLLERSSDEMTFTRLTWRDAVKCRSVWLYVLCIALKRVCFPVMPYFFEIGNTYGVSTTTLVHWVQVSAVASVVFNLACSALSDYLKTSSGPLSSGGRNVLFGVLVIQIAALSVLSFNKQGHSGFFPWALATSVLRTTLQSHFSMAILLANDLFGSQNMALMSGFAGGIAIGLGEAAATGVLLATVMHDDDNNQPSSYQLFYRVGLVISIISGILLCFVRKQFNTNSA